MTRMRPSGGYRELRSFQIATIVYDATYWFCEQFIDPRSRTCDQMVQAARSGRQNIAEGSRASAASSQTELRLVNVARASLEELLLDYEDFLRHRRLPQWAPEAPQAMAVREIGRRQALAKGDAAGVADRADRTDRSDRSDPSDPSDQPEQAPTRVADDRRYALYARWLDSREPDQRANALICLIHQANTLLDRQIEALEHQFVEGGGYSEQLAAARITARERRRHGAVAPDQAIPADRIPACPECGQAMALRTAKQGQHAGHQFWGCTAYPDCKGVVRI